MTPEIARIYYPVVIPVVLLIAGLLVLLKFKVKKDNTYDWIIRGVAIFTLAMIIINRITKVFFYLPDGATGWVAIPDTICSFCGTAFAIALIVKPRESFVLHGLFYVAVFGFFFGTFTPNYLNDYPFDALWTLIVVTSVLFHIGLGTLCTLLLLSKRFYPSVNKWWVPVLTFGVTYLVGLLEWKVLNFNTEYCDVMNLVKPLVANAGPFIAFITSWYMLWVGAVIGTALIAVIFELAGRKKKFIDVLKSFNPFAKQ